MNSTVSNIRQREYRTLISGPFYKCELYNNAGDMVLSRWLEQSEYLDNSIKELDCMPFSEGDTTEMATKINRTVLINGERRWIHANTEQEYADKLFTLVGCTETVERAIKKHPFEEYAMNWFETYSKPNIATVTATTYKRQLTRYILPTFGDKAVEDITTDDVQRLFNDMDGAKATKDKVKEVLNQIMDAAVEDRLIVHNPLKSKRLKVNGAKSKCTETYTTEQMRYLVQHLGNIQKPMDRAFLAILALHPLRLEEVLGLYVEDVDKEDMTLHVCRAVTHPDRNRPEVKDTKTAASHRTIGLSAIAAPYLPNDAKGPFLFGGDKPLSYTQVRKMCERIKRDTDFSENITPIRFRTTVLTDLYDQTKDIKAAQMAAGHTTSTMTLKYYVKGRETSAKAAAAIDKAYSGEG